MKALNWSEIVRLRDKEGLTFEQIAERLGKTKGAIYNAYRRAKAGKPISKPGAESKLRGKPKKEAGKPPSKPATVVGLPESLLPDVYSQTFRRSFLGGVNVKKN